MQVLCGKHNTIKTYTNNKLINCKKIKHIVYNNANLKTTLYTNRRMCNHIKINDALFTTEKFHFYTVSNMYICFFLYNDMIHIYNLQQYTIDKPVAVFKTFAANPCYVSVFTSNTLIVFTSNTLTIYDLVTNKVISNAGQIDIGGAPFTYIPFKNETTSYM